MKADLHVHSKHSKRPSQWILQKINCPESFTEPRHLYKKAKERGMSLVTITDHNTIAGALELAHLPDVFIGEEVTTYFPDDGCKIHVLIYNIREDHHKEIQKIRENIFDLVRYLWQEDICHVLAHPLFAVNDRLSVDHFEKLLLLFKNLELNGAREESQNQFLQCFLSELTPEDIRFLTEKHGIEPTFPEPWKKNLTGGSDDHSSLNIARRYTEVKGAADPDAFLRGIVTGKATVHGRATTPQTMAYNLYGVAYQFYRHNLNLEQHVQNDLLLRFLDRFLRRSREREERVWARLHSMWNWRRWPRRKSENTLSIQQLFRMECQKLILGDPDLMKTMRDENSESDDMEGLWFDFVNKISNKVLPHFGNHLLDQISGANLLNLFNTLGSAGALYSMLAPYLLSFSVFTKDRQLSPQILKRFPHMKSVKQKDVEELHIVHFTDTFHEVNGVALTLKQQAQIAAEKGKKLIVVTCHEKDDLSETACVRNFRPVGVYDLPMYEGQKLFYPPFLEMLDYCYKSRFTHIHSATPGPLGLAALAISKILKLPISATYHTSFPQYAGYLMGDNEVEGLMCRYIFWYYSHMDKIFVPSWNTGKELIGRGISTQKIRLFPRGIDTQRFHPSKRSKRFEELFAPEGQRKLLYVGRISREKNLDLLADVFQSLLCSISDVCLIVVGDGPYKEEMQEKLKGWPVVFTGYLEGDELASAYASCDLFVFPSTTDTFGNVVMEAQASGLPVIVTDAGGPQENLINGETGLVVRAGDPKAFLQGIRTLLLDKRRLHHMGKAARRYMEKRSFDKAFEKTWQIYKEKHDIFKSPLAQAI